MAVDNTILNDREQWIIDELRKGTPVYVESKTLIRKFSIKFFPERKGKDKHGFGFITEFDKTKKDFQKCLRSLRNKNVIEKKAMGVHGSKTDFLLGRNWIWAWRLKVITK